MRKMLMNTADRHEGEMQAKKEDLKPIAEQVLKDLGYGDGNEVAYEEAVEIIAEALITAYYKGYGDD